jgi:hypothetical protein
MGLAHSTFCLRRADWQHFRGPDDPGQRFGPGGAVANSLPGSMGALRIMRGWGYEQAKAIPKDRLGPILDLNGDVTADRLEV